MVFIRFVITILSSICVSTTLASPFVITDPINPWATNCGWAMDGGTRTDYPVVSTSAGAICRYDIAGVTGSHTINVNISYVDPIYGRLESPNSAPFSFNVPTALNAPVGLRISP